MIKESKSKIINQAYLTEKDEKALDMWNKWIPVPNDFDPEWAGPYCMQPKKPGIKSAGNDSRGPIKS